MSDGSPESMRAAIQAFLDEFDTEQSEQAETAYAELMEHTVAESFEAAENVAEDFYEDYRMLGRFEVFHALLNGDSETFGRLVEETAAFVEEEA